MFTAGELTELRADQAASFDKTCVVGNPAIDIADAAGGTTPGAVTNTSVACRIGAPRGNDEKVAERLGIVVDTVLTLPWDVSINPRSTVTVNGNTYEVTDTNQVQSYQTATRVFARRIV